MITSVYFIRIKKRQILEIVKAGLMEYGKPGDTFQKRAELYLKDCGITQEAIEKFRAITLGN